jgi:hypothetical protein
VAAVIVEPEILVMLSTDVAKSALVHGVFAENSDQLIITENSDQRKKVNAKERGTNDERNRKWPFNTLQRSIELLLIIKHLLLFQRMRMKNSNAK